MQQHAEDITGAWLVLEGSKEPSSTTLFQTSRPEHAELTRAECLALATSLASWRGGSAAAMLERIEAACLEAGASGGILGLWTAAVGATLESCPDRDGLPAGSGEGLLARLGRDLRFASLPSAMCGEAEVLAATMRLQQEHRALRQRFEERLRELRLEGVRQLAYGAGHEINNPLANIATRGQALLRDEPDPERRRKLATIVDQAFRARDMIGGLMVFAKPPVAQPVRLDLGALVESVVGSLGDLFAASSVGVEVHVPGDEVAAFADPHLVAETLHAILVNACEAVPQGGLVAVAVEAVPRGGMLAVRVEDNGPGFSDAGAMVACDPFHSGRDAGRGLGIGLSKAWALAKACGGGLRLGSTAGGGGLVELELPVWEEVANDG
ncbi:MAG: sensor histidine kinase [Pirellulales bacterium]